jgi:hypothetical protein
MLCVTSNPLTLSVFILNVVTLKVRVLVEPGNTKGGSITVPLTSCLTGLKLTV